MMTVYTQLQAQDVQAISDQYHLRLMSYDAITEGASNTNYLLRADRGCYTLTLFEEQTYAQVVELGRSLRWLQAWAYPTSYPLVAQNGETVLLYKGKPVLLKEYVEGSVVRNLSDGMLRQVGAMMARLHQIPLPDSMSSRPLYGARQLQHIVGQNLN